MNRLIVRAAFKIVWARRCDAGELECGHRLKRDPVLLDVPAQQLDAVYPSRRWNVPASPGLLRVSSWLGLAVAIAGCVPFGLLLDAAS